MRSLVRVLTTLQLVAVAVLVGAIALLLVGVAPTFAGYETFTVLSGSMEPTIRVGSLAVVQPVPTDQLQADDIVTYRTPAQPDVLVTHRLLSIQRTEEGKLQYQTKGDANTVADLVLVEPNAVLGRVVYSVPYAGYLGDFAKRPQGMLLFVGIPGLLLALDFLREKVRGGRRPVAEPVVAAPSAVAPSAAPGVDPEQVAELLTLGRQALEAGQRELASEASDKVIQIDPRNDEAWLLKADCAVSDVERISTLRTATVLNPNAARLMEQLRAAEVKTGP